MDSQRIEPNMTPILDMVFQLITFFMMVINFRASEFNREVTLPVVGSAAPVEEQVVRDMLVLNVKNDGSVISRGEPQPWIEGYAKAEMKRFQVMQQTNDAEKLDVTVVLRADRQLEYGKLNKVVEACKAAGFHRFDFVVMRKAKEGGGAK